LCCSAAIVAPRRQAGIVGREPETSRSSIAATDSLHRPDSSGPADRSDPDAASFPYQAAALGLQRIGLGHSNQRRISLPGWQLQRSKKMVAVRGLNPNHNHDLKNIFKAAATLASVIAGPFQDFYTALLAKGMKVSMARLTLARKIAAITLIVWKKGVGFDAEHLKQQAA